MSDAVSEPTLAEVVRGAVEELDAEHYPMRFDGRPVTDDNAVGCAMCYPHDGSWPCTSRLIADDLRWATPATPDPEGAQP